MDAIGARLLAARIAAGVRIGSVIELMDDSDSESNLHAGDRGVVRGIEAGGAIIVEWDRGFESALDPRYSAYRPLPAVA